MRSLKSQVGWCKRMQWGLAVAMLLSAGLFYLLGYHRQNARLRQLQKEIGARREQVAQNQAKARNLPVLAAEVYRLQANLDRFDKKLTRPLDWGQLVKEVTQISQQCGVQRFVWQPSGSRRSGLLLEAPVCMSFEGDFLSAVSFLRQVEDLQRLTRLKEVRIEQKDPKLGLVQVAMTMNIYSAERRPGK